MAVHFERHKMCLLLLLMVTLNFWCNGEKMIFKTGFEYQYTFDSTAELVNVGRFLIKAKLGFTNIQNLQDRQEILLKVHKFSFAPVEQPSIIGHNLDLSEWFSFVVTHRGEILQVYHPPKEDDEVLAVKKGFAGLLAAKIHTEEEMKQDNPSGQLEYLTEEFGHEGHHSAKYTVQKTAMGKVFKKVRSKYEHPISHAVSSFEKTLHFHDNLETIHSVMVKEDLLIPGTSKSEFDPYYAMRPVKAVNDFEREEFPEIRTIINGELQFLTRAGVDSSLLKRQENLTTGTIQIPTKVRKMPVEKNLTRVLEDVQENLTCIVRQPKKGSPDYNRCSLQLERALRDLPMSELDKLADYHFGSIRKQLSSYTAQVEQETILDALGSLQTNASQMILYKYIFTSVEVDERLVQRLLFHISVMDELPSQLLIHGVKQICDTRYLGKRQLSTETYHRAVLSLGSIARKLDKHGQKDQAKEIAQYLQNMLGLHDPWVYRQKRSTMTEEESIEYDTYKVTLVGALGNARHDDSYHYIISHINDTNSPWIKRAAVYALRQYLHQDVSCHVKNSL